MIISLQVQDLLLEEKDPTAIGRFKEDSSLRFEVNDLGEAKIVKEWRSFEAELNEQFSSCKINMQTLCPTILGCGGIRRCPCHSKS